MRFDGVPAYCGINLRLALLTSLGLALSAGACGDDEGARSRSNANGGSAGAGTGGGSAASSGTAPTGGTPSRGGSAGNGPTGGNGGSTGKGGSAGTSSGSGGDSGDGGDGEAGASGGVGANGGEAGAAGDGGEGGLPPLPPPQIFGPVQTLASGTLGRPIVAMGRFGTATVLWANDANDTVWSRMSTDKIFAGDVRMDSNNGRPSVSPFAIAAIGQTGFLAVWGEASSGFGAYARRYSGTWSGVQTLEDSASFSVQPDLSLNRAGDGVLGLAIRSTMTVGDESAQARRVSSGSIGAPEDLSLHRDMLSVRTAAADNGNAVVIWRQAEGTGFELWARRLDHATGFAAAERFAVTRLGFLSQLAAFDDGRVIVIWEEDPPTDSQLWESVYRPGSGWSSTPLPFEYPRAFDGGSSVLTRARSGALLWASYRAVGGNDSTVFYRIRSPSGVWSAEQIVSESAWLNRGAALATYDLESFRIVYHKANPNVPGENHLWSARYVPGYGFVNHQPFATETYSQDFSDVAVDETGRGIVSWLNRIASPIDSTEHLRVRWFE